VNHLPNHDLEGGVMQSDHQSAHEKVYVCIHMKSGEEEKVASMIVKLFPEVEAHDIEKI
jgi:hypothetical protein